jgi:hypothetical protein
VPATGYHAATRAPSGARDRGGTTMRRIVGAAVVALAVLLATSARASMDMDALKDTSPRERAEVQTLMMKKKLHLTDAELPKVEAINHKFAEQADPVLKGSEGIFKRLREYRRIDDAKDAELKKVLTAEQFSQYLANKEAMRDKMMDHILEHRKGSF